MLEILINWVIMAISVLIAAYILPGVVVVNFIVALLISLVLGALNAFIKPILIILTLPINILTLGLFTLVINAFLILLTASLVPGFNVGGFWWALLYSIVLTIVLFLANFLFKNTKNTYF